MHIGDRMGCSFFFFPGCLYEFRLWTCRSSENKKTAWMNISDLFACLLPQLTKCKHSHGIRCGCGRNPARQIYVVLNVCAVCSLMALLLRYCRHQTSKHGGSDGGDNSGRVPPSPLPLVRVQQQQGNAAPLWHESLGSLRQTYQTWGNILKSLLQAVHEESCSHESNAIIFLSD